MKKLLAMLLTLALLAAMAAIPALAESTLLSWNGFEVRATGYSYKEDSDGYAYIRLDVHIVNNSSHPIWLHLDNVMIDGTPIRAAGVSGIKVGATMDDWIMFKPDDSNKDGGDGAIRTGSQIDMTLILDDDETYDELCSRDVSINLYDLSVGGGDYNDYGDDTPTDFGHGGASNASYAPSYTPASYDFTTLKKGSKGQAVRDLQQRLTDLGYMNDKVDGSFGAVTGIAVMSFCSQNGLVISPEASPEMQQLLYSSGAQYYQEPYIPLVIGTEYTWKSHRNDIGGFSIQLVNRSNREIRGYEMYFYRENMWGEKIYDDDGDWLYKYEELQTFTGGRYQNTPQMYFSYFAYTYTIWAGVKRVVFADGEVREIAYDDITWFPCVVKKK